MWCSHCQRDVPAVSETGFNGVRCTQCGKLIEAQSDSPIAQTSSVAVQNRSPVISRAARDKTVDRKDSSPIFIEVDESSPVKQGHNSGEKTWRVDAAHTRKSKREQAASTNPRPQHSANPGASRQRDLAKSSSQPLRLKRPAFGIQFGILVMLVGFTLSFWAMITGHFLAWASGQVTVALGTAFGFYQCGKHIERLSTKILQDSRSRSE